MDYRHLPRLYDDLLALKRRLESLAIREGQAAALCAGRKYHVATARLTAVLLLGGTVDRTLTWSSPFDDDQYFVEWGMLDLEGQATITELSRSSADITVRITGGVVSIPLGACFMAFGRSM